MQNLRKYKGELGLLFISIVWGFGFVATDMALELFSPFQIMAVRFLLSSVSLAVISRKHLKNLSFKDIKCGVALGIVLYISFALQTVGVLYTTPSKNAFLTSVSVIIVPFISFLFYKSKLNGNEVFGAFLALFGIALISFKIDSPMNFGDFLTLLCAAGFAMQVFLTGLFLKKGVRPIVLTMIQLLTAGVVGVAVALFRNEINMISLAQNANFPKSFLAVMFLTFFSTLVAYLVQTASQKSTSEVKTAVILSTEAIFGTLFSVLILHEQLSFRSILGSVIIFISVLVSELGSKSEINEII